MAQRVRWELDEAEGEPEPVSLAPGLLERIIARSAITSHFQPLFSAENGAVFGYEALARVVGSSVCAPPNTNIAALFSEARRQGQTAALDMLCRRVALDRAAFLKLSNQYLFLNVCPESLTGPIHAFGTTDTMIEALGLNKDRIVLEITEESAVADYALFRSAVSHYRQRGYKIAIDDFGVGYGGLKMLAVIEPDYVKIDRHFILNIDKAIVKRNLVDSITTACHRLGIKVVAEGIERQEDLAVLLDMGIGLLQGYALGRPTENLLPPATRIALPRGERNGSESIQTHFIGDITHPAVALEPSATIHTARSMFIKDPVIMSLPVVENGRVIGMLHRRPFFEEVLTGPLGFGEALAAYRTIGQIADELPFICVEAQETLEEVATRLQGRKADSRYDDICVSSNGKYKGTVAISTLLAAITERSLNLARGSNPLSGLPGNVAIRREIERRIGQMMHFDVCYIDIDHFKPFNDNYGFDRGDQALRVLTAVIKSAVRKEGDPDDFIGHIGGDDFIVITRPQRSLALCRAIIRNFGLSLEELHGPEDYEAGGFEAMNRRGDRESFPLMALSLGIASTEVQHFESFAELASLASEVKKAAKAITGSSIVRDRRLTEHQIWPPVSEPIQPAVCS